MARNVSYTHPMDRPLSLRDEQVIQTRSALVAAARVLFGERGFAATSVEEVAVQARVTTGALYHHFPTKAALFEAVFEEVHRDLVAAAVRTADGASGGADAIGRAFESFLEAVLDPQVQRVVITDAPAVLGLRRFNELDERYAFAAITDTLRAAHADGEVHVDDPETMARLLLGALSRGAMLIATSATPSETHDSVVRGLRTLVAGLSSGG